MGFSAKMAISWKFVQNLFGRFFVYKMAKMQNKQNSSYKILVDIICKDSIGGILFILLFGHFMNKKPSKNAPVSKNVQGKDFLVDVENFWYDASETTSLASHDASKIQKP